MNPVSNPLFGHQTGGHQTGGPQSWAARPAALPMNLQAMSLPFDPSQIDPAQATQDYSQWVTRTSPAYQMEQRGMPPSALVRYNPFYGNPLAYFQDRKTGNVPPLVNPAMLDWNTYRQYYGL